jgi:hypothetical protein
MISFLEMGMGKRCGEEGLGRADPTIHLSKTALLAGGVALGCTRRTPGLRLIAFALHRAFSERAQKKKHIMIL